MIHFRMKVPLQRSVAANGITTLRGSFSGRVVDGEIFNTGENTFEITARLRIQKGGNGIVTVSGLLDHNDFPPTFEGDLFQQP